MSNNLTKTNFSILILFLLLFQCFNVNAQSDIQLDSENDKKPITNVNWTQIESKDKDFSILFPENFSVVLDSKIRIAISNMPNINNIIELKDFYSITAFQDDVSMWMASYDVKNGKKAFPIFLNYSRKNSIKNFDYKYKNFEMRELVFNKAKFHKSFYFYSKKRVFIVGVASDDESNPILLAFLNSIKVNGETIFNITTGTEYKPVQNLILESLKNSPLEIEYSKDFKAELNSKPSNIDSESKDKDETSMVLLDTPKVEYSKEARSEKINDYVLLDVTFGSNGLIQKINVLKDLEYGLTEQAIIAARQIRFFPQKKNNNPTTTVKRVRYQFTIN